MLSQIIIALSATLIVGAIGSASMARAEDSTTASSAAKPTLNLIPVRFFDPSTLPKKTKEKIKGSCSVTCALLRRTSFIARPGHPPLDVSFLDIDDDFIVNEFGGPATEASLVYNNDGKMNLYFFWKNFGLPQEIVPLEMSKIIISVFQAMQLGRDRPGFTDLEFRIKTYSTMVHALREVQQWPDFNGFAPSLKAQLQRDIFCLGKKAFREMFQPGPYELSCAEALRKISN